MAWRSSGGYDVYMICDAMPTLPDEYTFDDSHASTIHVKPELVDQYKADQWWGMHNIVPLGVEFIEFTVDGIKYKQTAEDEVSVTYSTDSKPGSSNPNLYTGDINIPAQRSCSRSLIRIAETERCHWILSCSRRCTAYSRCFPCLVGCPADWCQSLLLQ